MNAGLFWLNLKFMHLELRLETCCNATNLASCSFLVKIGKEQNVRKNV